ILLPLARRQARPLPESRGQRIRKPLPGRPTILLVEDEDSIRHLVKRSLRSMNYTVISCPNGLAALAALEQFTGNVDLLVTDVVMPCLGGLELAQRLKARIPGLKVLFCSGSTGAEAFRTLSATNEPYLQKPYTMQDLSNRIRELLESDQP
ncbi:MAG: response regulator, partial [Acidobacteria bacterium]|nr:response regulator [Acidobacteriota bacterium]